MSQPVLDTINEIKATIAKHDPNGLEETATGVVPGATIQTWTRSGGLVRNLIDSANPDIRRAGVMVKEALDDGLEALGTGNGLADLMDARAKWRNLMSIEPL